MLALTLPLVMFAVTHVTSRVAVNLINITSPHGRYVFVSMSTDSETQSSERRNYHEHSHHEE